MPPKIFSARTTTDNGTCKSTNSDDAKLYLVEVLMEQLVLLDQVVVPLSQLALELALLPLPLVELPVLHL